MRYLLLNSMLLLTSCAKQADVSPTNTIVFPSDTFLYQQQPSVPKRVVMLHGLRGSHSTFFIDPYVQMYNALIQAGWQIVMFDFPYAEPSFWTDTGFGYEQGFMAKLNQALDQADHELGPVTQTVLLGVSFGGIHALVGASQSNRVTGYVGVVPVVKINWLTEFQGQDTSGMDNQVDPSALATKPGYLIWGEQDQRVNYQFTVDLAGRIGDLRGSVTTEAHPELDHTFPNDVSTMINWMLTTF